MTNLQSLSFYYPELILIGVILAAIIYDLTIHKSKSGNVLTSGGKPVTWGAGPSFGGSGNHPATRGIVQNANIVFSKPNTKIIELKANPLDDVIKNLAIKNNLIHKSIDCALDEVKPHNQFGHVRVPMEELDRILKV